MKNTSRNINIHGGIDKQDPNVSIPDTWAENSNRNIQDSQGIHLSLRFLISRSKKLNLILRANCCILLLILQPCTLQVLDLHPSVFEEM